jgi:hypothetical protein
MKPKLAGRHESAVLAGEEHEYAGACAGVPNDGVEVISIYD